jgi:single-strand DNA-binding protein
MKTLAKVHILGIVGQTPELKQAKSGLPIATFPVATMVKRKDPNGEPFEATLWHNVVAFGKTAENASKIVTKGSKIYLDGTLDYQEYQDSTGGQKLSTKIMLNDFSILQKPEERMGNVAPRKTVTNEIYDGIPF